MINDGLGSQPFGQVKRFLFLNRKPLFFSLAGVLGILAYLRGTYLLGHWTGVAYVAVSLCLVWLLARSLKRRSALHISLVAALCLIAGTIMTFPATFNSDMQHFIDHQAVDRLARDELAKVFASDAAFREVSVTSVHRRGVQITISGMVSSDGDLARLRSRVDNECPALHHCIVNWDVTIAAQDP